MREYTVKDVQDELYANGYKLVRRKGSHQAWSNGRRTISITCVKMNRAVAARIIKEIRNEKGV